MPASPYLDRPRGEAFSYKAAPVFNMRLPVTLLAEDVGLGKTIGAGLAMTELVVRSRLSKSLVVTLIKWIAEFPLTIRSPAPASRLSCVCRRSLPPL